jgi:hypothetical protein
MKATMTRIALIVIAIVTVGCQKQQAQRPCPAVDPEATVFSDLRSALVNTYKRHDGSDFLQHVDAINLETLDSIEIAHTEVWRNNLEHPDKPMGDVLGTRKELFGR